jgi:TolB-like protein/Flp pilus assembly protein TadD
MSPPDIPPSGATPGPEGSPLPGKKLDSWGEIASYLGREVRTVQRWEGTEGLPVHRHEHKKKSTVYAYSGELDAWIKNRQPKDDPIADDVFARQQTQQALNGTDSPVDVVEPLVAPPVVPPAPVPTADPIELPSPAGKRVVVALVALGILCGISLGVYRWLQSANTEPEKVRIAVLPFTYVSGDSEPDYITAGLTDVIRTKLGQLDPPHLGVIAATSSRIVAGQPIPEIGRVLNVKYVLEGGVQRAGGQVRIDVQLIQVSDQTHLWSESFTRELSDVLQVESDVSAAIARQILATLPVPSTPQPKLSVQAGTVHAATPEIAQSRHAFLQGKFALGSRGDFRGSIAFFQQAIDDDPKYAEAYAGLAAATAILGQVPNDGMPPSDAKPKAKEAAQQALQLNPKLAEAHAVLGNVAMSYDWDLATAEKELRSAIELAPNDPTPHEWYCHLLIVEGHNSEALAEARRALDLDPVSPLFHDVVAETYYFGRSYDAAIEEAQQVVKLHPGDLSAQFWLGSAYAQKKMYPQAVETFQRARKLSGDAPVMLMAYGYAQALAGNTDEARSMLKKLEGLRRVRSLPPTPGKETQTLPLPFIPSLYLAAIHVGLGETDDAFRELELAYRERVDRLVYLNVDPMADPLRSDPRFAQLMAKVGFH